MKTDLRRAKTRHIDLRHIVTDPLHSLRIALYVLCLTLMAGWVQRVAVARLAPQEHLGGLMSVIPPVQPPILAGRVEIQEGIRAYDGAVGGSAWDDKVTAVMVSMVMVYLVGPTLLVWGLRARAQYRMFDPKAPRVALIATALTLGGFSLVSLLPALHTAHTYKGLHEQMRSDAEAAQAMNRLSIEVSLMARKAQAAYFVAGEPWQLAGSWQLSDGSRKPALSIVQLIEPGVDAVIADSRHAVIEGRRYELSVERADSLTIRAQSHEARPRAREGTDGSSTALPGICVGVTPQAVTMQVWQ